MADLNKLEADAAKINNRQAYSDAIIDSKIAEIKADFAQFDGLSLDSPLTTLQINTGAFNGSSNNAIDIAVDGSGTWTTVSAHSDIAPKNIYYKAMLKQWPGDGGANIHTRTGATAYAMLKNLGIHTVMA